MQTIDKTYATIHKMNSPRNAGVICLVIAR